MRVVTGNAGRGHGKVGEKRLKILFSTGFRRPDEWACRISRHVFQPEMLELVGGTIMAVDGPKTDQLKIQTQLFADDQIL